MCEQELPATEFYSGRGACKVCFRADQQRRREAWTPQQREDAVARDRRYRDKHRERVREINRRSADRQRSSDPEGFAKRQRASSRAAALRRREIISAAKARPCTDCGVQFPAVAMDLHHRDPAQKLFSVSQMTTRAPAVIRAEIAKCDVLCSNCHRIRHWKERQNVPASVE